MTLMASPPWPKPPRRDTLERGLAHQANRHYVGAEGTSHEHDSVAASRLVSRSVAARAFALLGRERLDAQHRTGWWGTDTRGNALPLQTSNEAPHERVRDRIVRACLDRRPPPLADLRRRCAQ